MMNYNFIAPYYHALSQLTFLNRQHLAHFLILNYLKDGDKVLWVGGGAGKFISELEKLNINLYIDYVDISSKMIEISQKQKTKNIKINYIVSDIFNYELVKKYDVIMTAFLFDHFSQNNAVKLHNKLDQSLLYGGIWFYADFVENQKKWQKIITKSMLLFFRLVVGISIKKLPAMREIYYKRYDIMHEKKFFMHYIESIVFKKIDSSNIL